MNRIFLQHSSNEKGKQWIYIQQWKVLHFLATLKGQGYRASFRSPAISFWMSGNPISYSRQIMSSTRRSKFWNVTCIMMGCSKLLRARILELSWRFNYSEITRYDSLDECQCINVHFMPIPNNPQLYWSTKGNRFYFMLSSYSIKVLQNSSPSNKLYFWPIKHHKC